MDPINYSIDVATPFQSAMQGYQAGAAIRNDLQAQQQQQLALQQQQQQQQVIGQLIQNPNASADDYSRAMLLVPGMKDQLEKGWSMKNTAQQQSTLSDLLQWSAAVKNGAPQIAVDQINKRADAIESSAGGPTDQSQALRFKAKIIQASPSLGLWQINSAIAAAPNGKQAFDALQTQGQEARAQDQAPADLAIKNATAGIKGVEAANAPTATELGNQKVAEEIKTAQLKRDLDTIDTQIKASTSETDRGRLTLERDKLNAELAKTQQAQGTSAQDSQNFATNALQTVNDIKTHRGMDGYFTGPGTKWGAIWRVIPGSDRQALETNIDALKGQLGYSNLMAAKASSPTGASGFGALSEGELKLLSNLAGNLDPNSADFPVQLGKVERYLQKAQATAVARPNLPNTGEAFVMQHPKFGNVTEGQVNALMRQYPGSTREQVLQFLQQSGGK